MSATIGRGMTQIPSLFSLAVFSLFHRVPSSLLNRGRGREGEREGRGKGKGGRGGKGRKENQCVNYANGVIDPIEGVKWKKKKGSEKLSREKEK